MWQNPKVHDDLQRSLPPSGSIWPNLCQAYVQAAVEDFQGGDSTAHMGAHHGSWAAQSWTQLHVQQPHQRAEAKDHLCSANTTTCWAAQNTTGFLCCKGTLLVYVWVVAFCHPLERLGLAFAWDYSLYSSVPENSWNQEGTKAVRCCGTLHSMLDHITWNIPAGKCIFKWCFSVVALLQRWNLPWH